MLGSAWGWSCTSSILLNLMRELVGVVQVDMEGMMQCLEKASDGLISGNGGVENGKIRRKREVLAAF